MKIGDKVRDKTRGMLGTIIGVEPAQGPTQRVLIQGEPLKGQVAGTPHIKVWQTVQQTELIDLSGNPVQGKPGASLDASGQRVNATAAPMMAGTGSNYDSAGNQISATH